MGTTTSRSQVNSGRSTHLSMHTHPAANLIRPKYKNTNHHFTADGDRPRAWVREAHEVVQAFYTPERLLQLCDLVLERLLGLRPADLEVGLKAG